MPKRFRVALSFPGEKRGFVREVAAALAGVLGQDKVLYDDYLTAELARPNLDVYLGRLYHDESELIVPFFCADFEQKEWCGLELRQIRDLLKQRKDDHIMPFRFDDAPITGQLSIDGYIKVGDRSAQQVADLILQRLTVVTKAAAGPVKDARPAPAATEAQPLYYLFGSEGAAKVAAGDVFYSVQGKAVAQSLVRLFTKEYGAEKGAPVFHCQAADSIPAEDQVLLMETLDALAIYNDPDRLIYDPPPSEHTHELAQLAERAETWAELLKKRPPAKATAESGIGDGAAESIMPSDQRLNAGLNLLMLLAQCYYKLLESTVGNPCQALDLDLNQSYFWTVTGIQNLLENHEDLRDFPGEFKPFFADLYPSTIMDVDWEDMVAPDAEAFLSAVQRYALRKGISDPEENSHAAIFVALYRPSIDLCLERASNYRKRMRAHWQRVMEAATPKTESAATPSPKADPPQP